MQRNVRSFSNLVTAGGTGAEASFKDEQCRTPGGRVDSSRLRDTVSDPRLRHNERADIYRVFKEMPEAERLKLVNRQHQIIPLSELYKLNKSQINIPLAALGMFILILYFSIAMEIILTGKALQVFSLIICTAAVWRQVGKSVSVFLLDNYIIDLKGNPMPIVGDNSGVVKLPPDASPHWARRFFYTDLGDIADKIQEYDEAILEKRRLAVRKRFMSDLEVAEEEDTVNEDEILRLSLLLIFSNKTAKLFDVPDQRFRRDSIESTEADSVDAVTDADLGLVSSDDIFNEPGRENALRAYVRELIDITNQIKQNVSTIIHDVDTLDKLREVMLLAENLLSKYKDLNRAKEILELELSAEISMAKSNSEELTALQLKLEDTCIKLRSMGDVVNAANHVIVLLTPLIQTLSLMHSVTIQEPLSVTAQPASLPGIDALPPPLIIRRRSEALLDGRADSPAAADSGSSAFNLSGSPLPPNIHDARPPSSPPRIALRQLPVLFSTKSLPQLVGGGPGIVKPAPTLRLRAGNK